MLHCSSNSFCTATFLWHQSCIDLLGDSGATLACISIALLIFGMNFASAVFHFNTKTIKKAFSVTVIAINLTEMQYGIYLGTIWITNSIFQANFVLIDQIWRSAGTCFTIFGIVLFFTSLQQLELGFLSLSRLMIVIQPVDTVFKQSNFVVRSLSCFGLISLGLTFAATLLVKIRNGKIPTQFCLPFIDPTNSTELKAIAWSVIVSQTFTFVTIQVFQVNLVHTLLKTQEHATIH